MKNVQENTKHKYTSLIKATTGERLKPYSGIAEIRYILDTGLALTINEALNLDDIYLTLSSSYDALSSDIERKVNETIQQRSK